MGGIFRLAKRAGLAERRGLFAADTLEILSDGNLVETSGTQIFSKFAAINAPNGKNQVQQPIFNSLGIIHAIDGFLCGIIKEKKNRYLVTLLPCQNSRNQQDIN